MAVASVATELLRGKTADEALAMSPAELSAPLGALPPMKIHCAQLVEGALKQALAGGEAVPGPEPVAAPASSAPAPTLYDQLVAGVQAAPKKLKITLRPPA